VHLKPIRSDVTVRARRLGPDRVDRLVRDLIADYGVDATVVTTDHEPPHWRIVIRVDSDRVFDLDLPDTLTVAELRRQIGQYLVACL
jgi:hypothetical protein